MSSQFTVMEAELDAYRLCVIGDADLWFWCVNLSGDDLDEGTERTPGAAMAAAEGAVLLLRSLEQRTGFDRLRPGSQSLP